MRSLQQQALPDMQWIDGLNTRDQSKFILGIIQIHTRDQSKILFTWIRLVIAKQHLVQICRVDVPIEYVSLIFRMKSLQQEALPDMQWIDGLGLKSSVWLNPTPVIPTGVPRS